MGRAVFEGDRNAGFAESARRSGNAEAFPEERIPRSPAGGPDRSLTARTRKPGIFAHSKQGILVLGASGIGGVLVWAP